MARNFQQEGTRKTIEAPSSVESGDPIFIEDSLVVALESADSGDDVRVGLAGVYHSIPADDTSAFDDLAPLYWDDGDDQLVDDDGDGAHPFVGRAFGAKSEADPTCSIALAVYTE